MTTTRLLPVFFLAAVAACTQQQQPESAQAALAKLRGQPAANVVARLGPADRQEPSPGGTTYVWNTRYRPDRGPSPSPGPTYATGQPSTTGPSQSDAAQDSVCTLRLAVDGAGIVGGAQTIGDNAACAPFYRKLAGW